MPIFHYLSNLFNLFFFFFFFQQLQMINIQGALQIREKWQIFQYLLSSQRKIAQDKIAHFSIIQNNVVSPSPLLFFSFFFPSIYSLSQFTSQNLGYLMVVIQLGPWGAEMYLTANKFRDINLSFCPGYYFLFQHNTIQG